MATLAQIRSSIMGQALGHIPSDDSRLRMRFVEYQIRSARSELLKDLVRRQVGVPYDFYQRICCLPIKCDNIVCDGESIPVERTYLEIPALENVPHNPVYLGPADGKTPFTRVSFGQIGFWSGGSFSRKQNAFAILGNKAMLSLFGNMKMAESLCIHAILEDPLEKTCAPISENDQYPIPDNLIHKLEILVMKQLLATLPVKADDSNDGVDSQLNNPQQRTRPLE